MRRWGSGPATALPLISASQITLFRECARKWAFRYIAGIKTPQHPSAALGTEVDDTQLQPYLRDGRPFDYTRDSGYIAAAGLAFLPKPKTPGLEVQKHFVLPSLRGAGKWAYQGYMDLWLPDSKDVPDMPGGAPFVGDFKTTSDLKWAKSKEQLEVDVQAQLYAAHALHETRAEVVDLSWMYFQTRGAKKTKRTYLRVSQEHVVEQFAKIEETAEDLFNAKRTITDPLTLPPSPEQCEAYGGCPYRDKCNLSPTDHLAALAARDSRTVDFTEGLNMSSATTSLMENLKARKAGAQVTQAKPQTLESAAPSPPAPSDTPSLEEHIKANPRAAFLTQEPVALGINPPEKDLPPPPPAPAAKRGPGRPKKQPPPDPVGADVAAAVTPAPEPKQLDLEFKPQDSVRIDAPVDIVADKLAALIVDRIAARLAGK